MNKVEISETAMMDTLNALCGAERANIVREVYLLIEAAEQRGYTQGCVEAPAICPACLQANTEEGKYNDGYEDGYKDGIDEGFNDGVNSVDFATEKESKDRAYEDGYEDGYKQAFGLGYDAGVADERIASDPEPGVREYTEEEFYRAMDEAYERGFTDCSRNS